MTDTEATEATEPQTGEKPEVTPEQKAQRHATRVVARTLSKMEGKGTPEEMKKRWEEGKTKFTGTARKLVKAITKDGISLQLDEAGTNKAKRAAKRGAKAEGGDDDAED